MGKKPNQTEENFNKKNAHVPNDMITYFYN